MDPELEPLYYSIPKAARRLGVGADMVRALIDNGMLRTTQMGRRKLIGRRTLEQFELDHQEGQLVPGGVRGTANRRK